MKCDRLDVCNPTQMVHFGGMKQDQVCVLSWFHSPKWCSINCCKFGKIFCLVFVSIFPQTVYRGMSQLTMWKIKIIAKSITFWSGKNSSRFTRFPQGLQQQYQEVVRIRNNRLCWKPTVSFLYQNRSIVLQSNQQRRIGTLQENDLLLECQRNFLDLNIRSFTIL